jgi:hypothetical protein
MNFAAFILSTGRCGTQWLATALAEAYPDRLAVAHEPLHAGYQARKVLQHTAVANDAPQLPQQVVHHLEAIENRLETLPYIECGHPSWSTIPCLAERFRGRVKIIHLVRHPVPTSWSWLTLQAFVPPLLPHIKPRTLLTPFDEGSQFAEYRSRWDTLAPFEKCLYYWTEVNAFALALQSRLDAPWLRLRHEDLFDGDGLGRLLEFLQLPPRETILRRRCEVIDDNRSILPTREDWRVIRDHPRAVAIAQQLGYAVDAVDELALERRYLCIPAAPAT